MSKRLNKTFRKLAVPGLMKHLVIIMGVVYVFDYIFQGDLSRYLLFDRAAIFSGQVWRLVSFAFLPLATSPLFLVFALYFYWLIGDSLEREWGVARFNLYYLLGFLAAMVAGFITGYTTNHYLNLSLFFAFALLYPDFPVRLFFILSIKIKWLAALNAAYYLYAFIVSGWPGRTALLLSLLNLILFFQKDLRQRIQSARRRRAWRNQFKQ